MARIKSVAHAFPPHQVMQQEIKETLLRTLPLQDAEFEELGSIFEHSQIKQRQLAMPLDWYQSAHTATERNQAYQMQGYPLLLEAAKLCLEKAQFAPTQVDHLIFVSSTGHATPTLDAFLINELGLKATTSRSPLWGLGCAAGAAGLSRAFEYCTAFPERNTLLVALECCSLAFASQDVSKKNLVAASLFGDGAAAALVVGEKAHSTRASEFQSPQIFATHSFLFPDSYPLMGWEFQDRGMQLVLSPRLPVVIKQELPRLVESFLHTQGLLPSQITDYVTHPGGARVVEAYQAALNLLGNELILSQNFLTQHGNVSSVSVLVVLEEWLAQRKRDPKRVVKKGLISAFGPGFSAELILFQE